MESGSKFPRPHIPVITDGVTRGAEHSRRWKSCGRRASRWGGKSSQHMAQASDSLSAPAQRLVAPAPARKTP